MHIYMSWARIGFGQNHIVKGCWLSRFWHEHFSSSCITRPPSPSSFWKFSKEFSIEFSGLKSSLWTCSAAGFGTTSWRLKKIPSYMMPHLQKSQLGLWRDSTQDGNVYYVKANFSWHIEQFPNFCLRQNKFCKISELQFSQ